MQSLSGADRQWPQDLADKEVFQGWGARGSRVVPRLHPILVSQVLLEPRAEQRAGGSADVQGLQHHARRSRLVQASHRRARGADWRRALHRRQEAGQAEERQCFFCGEARERQWRSQLRSNTVH